ncbi:UDP-glucose 4-epimerase GalE [Carbonactinospora thermoautotrophica]|uniref:UDP-glucose 4-epimerase GalE n=1 Tax=Carbonactinospora thermoautotrophica TaxID=1469144 RepID=UPI00226DB14E|nr:UDP-glucose 4-epimerase GalE [Carbonactinospora thermoautotrophica]MCX9190382.1 UDP-glucose 4-epimerase GalE [Carbonactinospora thermoautotrophica]
MRLLVTGGAGYVGSVVAAQLVETGHEVTVLDDLSGGRRDSVPDGAAYVAGDVAAEAGAVLATGGYDGVLHFAARSLVGESVEDPRAYWEANVGGALALLAAMREHRVPRLVFSSTAAVYGDPQTVPVPEDAPCWPANPYGASKLAADHAIAGYARAYRLAAVSLRYFNVAGAYGRYGERHDPETHLIPLVLQAAAGQRDAVTVYGTDYPTPDGTCVRDYIHVADLARAHLLALDALGEVIKPGTWRVYNLGNGDGFSVWQVIETAERVTGRAVPVREGARRTGDPAVLVASSARARAELGWTPTRPALADMIADAWAFLTEGAALTRLPA